MSRILFLLTIALQLFLTGCLPVTSSSPLGTTVAATLDRRLAGIWRGKLGTSTDVVYLAFYPAAHGLGKIVLLASPTGGDEGGWIVLEARGATLGGNTYLDGREIEDNGGSPDSKLAHIPILYKFGDDGLLTLYLVDEKAAVRPFRMARSPA